MVMKINTRRLRYILLSRVLASLTDEISTLNDNNAEADEWWVVKNKIDAVRAAIKEIQETPTDEKK